MRRIKDILEQHREKGRFKPVVPRYVPSVAVVSPRPSSDSADVKLKEDGGLAQNTLLDKKKKPMSPASAEISFQSVKEMDTSMKEAKDEKDKLREELTKVLDELTYAKIAETQANLAKNAADALKMVPLPIFVG